MSQERPRRSSLPAAFSGLDSKTLEMLLQHVEDRLQQSLGISQFVEMHVSSSARFKFCIFQVLHISSSAYFMCVAASVNVDECTCR